MKKIVGYICVLFSSFLLFSTTVTASHETWNHVVDDMETILNKSYETYTKGDSDQSKIEVDEAYYGYYEKLGFEKTVMSYISGNRASVVEYQFSTIKKAMTAKKDKAEVREDLDVLIQYLREDANQLDGVEKKPMTSFLASLTIILREGFEAILIVGVIIAYLVKMGYRDKLKAVYLGSVLALLLSVVMAYILNRLSALSGANQEIVEGVTMLIAVVVLFYVSNWMISKSEADAWSHYIEGKVDTSLKRGSLFSLSFAAFLAVFREGAETIIFYQALLADSNQYPKWIWIGLAVGCVGLVLMFLTIRYLSIKIPMKPFFTATSGLLFVMAISFLGNGIKELQEGNIIDVTPISGFSAVSLFGIYPTVETFVPQLILLVITILTVVIQVRKLKNKKIS